jgi:hypothetical protein
MEGTKMMESEFNILFSEALQILSEAEQEGQQGDKVLALEKYQEGLEKFLLLLQSTISPFHRV